MHFNPIAILSGLFLRGGVGRPPQFIHRFRPPSLYRVKSERKKLDAFNNNCLRRIFKIFWPNQIKNEDLWERTSFRPVTEEVKRRRLRWLGQTLRMEQDRITKMALWWNPLGRRKRGRPRTTWRMCWRPSEWAGVRPSCWQGTEISGELLWNRPYAKTGEENK